ERFSDSLVRTHPRSVVTVDRLAEALHPGHPLLDQVAAAIAEGVRAKRLQRLPDQVKDSTLASEPDEEDEDSRAQHLSFEAVILSIDAARAGSPAYQRALAAARPRLILEAQRALAQGREVAITVLGQLRTQPDDGPETVLVGVLEDA